MISIVIGLLIGTSVYLVLYQLNLMRQATEDVHLPQHIINDSFEMAQVARRKTVFDEVLKSHSVLGEKLRDFEHKISTAGLKKRLQRAGSPIGALEFFAFKVLTMSLVPVVVMVFFGNLYSKNVLLAGSLAVGFMIPELWLNAKTRKRQNNIKKDLPNIIDLLNLCVSGGLDFMLAINRVVKDLRPCELTQELAEVYRETQMGKTRREALKNFAERTDVPEVHSFVRTLIQADRMGSPMSEILKMQSEDMRVRRFQRGEAMALKAPIKLLLPLFVFILPVVLVIVAGPIMIQFSKSNIGF